MPEMGTAMRVSVSAEPRNTVFARAERACDARRGRQFGPVALAVIDRQAVAVVPGFARHREHGGRIKAAGEEYHCVRHI